MGFDYQDNLYVNDSNHLTKDNVDNIDKSFDQNIENDIDFKDEFDFNESYNKIKSLDDRDWRNIHRIVSGKKIKDGKVMEFMKWLRESMPECKTWEEFKSETELYFQVDFLKDAGSELNITLFHPAFALLQLIYWLEAIDSADTLFENIGDKVDELSNSIKEKYIQTKGNPKEIVKLCDEFLPVASSFLRAVSNFDPKEKGEFRAELSEIEAQNKHLRRILRNCGGKIQGRKILFGKNIDSNVINRAMEQFLSFMAPVNRFSKSNEAMSKISIENRDIVNKSLGICEKMEDVIRNFYNANDCVYKSPYGAFAPHNNVSANNQFAKKINSAQHINQPTQQNLL